MLLALSPFVLLAFTVHVSHEVCDEDDDDQWTNDDVGICIYIYMYPLGGLKTFLCLGAHVALACMWADAFTCLIHTRVPTSPKKRMQALSFSK